MVDKQPMEQTAIRLANKEDLTALLEIENGCFTTDKLSRRSFKHFIKNGAHQLWLFTLNGQVIGYSLLLYRTGTSLARLYSIVLVPEARGKGYASEILKHAEQQAAERLCVYMRLEVNQQNQAAIKLYQSFGYKTIGELPGYYEDGGDAFKMEKRIVLSAKRKHRPKPYYQQTTEFTCGPASLMMAMKTLDKNYEMTRHEELQIWREATTIFMTSGHGGCSPHGLALSAWRRGFKVKLCINTDETPFEDGLRSEEKKHIIRLVHQEFLSQMAQTDIDLSVQQLSDAEMDSLLESEYPVLALISTWRFNRNKAPHWVYVAASDDACFYINDPDMSGEDYLTQTDFEQVPVKRQSFNAMARFGQKKLRALLVISPQKS
ncbi:GNAT family N-acetyltransferase/peptidase C39 family protein [Thiomicrorhabdus sp. Kp2]|uniref:GNAT family N-acetyltransferase/peptidase C39 family protein n=1 Tax=Thiomicrorhabdus sp. Kp2 TaxID=1123518 RepID=UPI00040405F1|nr:GNAT family N-acetyltransferase/peptidase C39 family protein [Thiomicrorhabdus sp. Kp2]